MLVSSISFSAFNASATLPATRSALMLYDSPLAPTPIGAITGMKSPLTSRFSRSVLIPTTSPTWPMSMISGVVISGVWRVTVSFFARISSASLPVRPMALPP
ncbi:hypothetical protein D3C84_969130 [compost metagenome]